MSLEQITRIVGSGNPNREKDDFYATPAYAIDALLKREKFEGTIWEPACGDGAICERLIAHGYNGFQISATDLVYRGYGTGSWDFLNPVNAIESDNIITNPPFKLGTKFAIHALNIAKKKVVLFNKLTFLEGKERRDKLFSRGHLQKVYVFSERVGFNGGGGMMAFAWFVFDKEWQGKAEIEWI